MDRKFFICLIILFMEILDTPWDLVGLYEAPQQNLSEEGHQKSYENLHKTIGYGSVELLSLNDCGAVHCQAKWHAFIPDFIPKPPCEVFLTEVILKTASGWSGPIFHQFWCICLIGSLGRLKVSRNPKWLDHTSFLVPWMEFVLIAHALQGLEPKELASLCLPVVLKSCTATLKSHSTKSNFKGSPGPKAQLASRSGYQSVTGIHQTRNKHQMQSGESENLYSCRMCSGGKTSPKSENQATVSYSSYRQPESFQNHSVIGGFEFFPHDCKPSKEVTGVSSLCDKRI